MTKKYFLLFLIFSQMPFIIAQSDSIVYKRPGSYFVFYSDSTYKFFNIPCDICPPFADNNNLISFGRYAKYKNKAIYLYSDTILDNIDLSVIESIDKSPYFKIHVTMPAQEDSSNMLRSHYFYALRIFYERICNDSINYFAQEYYQNNPLFTIPKDSTLHPINITVGIYPKQAAYGKSFFKKKHIVNNKKNNVYTIAIPQFVTGYLDYERMFHYRLDILNKHMIGDSFNQRVYIREDIYRKRNYDDWHFPVCPSWQYRVKPLIR